MADDIDHSLQESDALLARADTLLARRKIDVQPAPEIPVLTETVPATGSSPAAAVPTLTDIVAPRPPGRAATAETALEQTMYRKLKRLLDRETAGFSQPLPPEAAAALERTLKKISGELKDDLDTMVRAAVEDVLRGRAQEPPPRR